MAESVDAEAPRGLGLRPVQVQGLPRPQRIVKWNNWHDVLLRYTWPGHSEHDYWVRIALVWKPDWGTDSWWATRGIVWARGWRLGPLGLGVFRLLSTHELRSRLNGQRRQPP